MNKLKYLLAYFTANFHYLYHKFLTNSWHKDNVGHCLIVHYKGFRTMSVQCQCGEIFWRRNAEQISRSAKDRCHATQTGT